MKMIMKLMMKMILVGGTIALCATEARAQEATPREPAYAFVVEKRRFINPDGDTSGTAELVASFEESGWSETLEEPRTGHQYIARRSVVEISADANGDLKVIEAVLVKEGTRELVLQKAPLQIPLVTNPHAAGNLLLARHPLAMVVPRFQELIEFNMSDKVRQEHPSGNPRVYTNDWIYVLNLNDEGTLADITQFHRTTNMLVKRVAFEGWHIAPSGRHIPNNVYVRTYRGDDSKPVAEVRYIGIEEEELAGTTTEKENGR